MTTEPGTGKKAEPTPEKDKAARERVQRRAEERVKREEADQAERDTSAIEAGTGRRAETVTVTEAGTGRKAEVSATELERAERERITRQPTEIEAGTGRRAGTVAVTEAGTGRIAEVPVTEIERAQRRRRAQRETTPPPGIGDEPSPGPIISLLDKTGKGASESTPETVEDRRTTANRIVESLKQIGYSSLAAANAAGEKTVPLTVGTGGSTSTIHVRLKDIPGESLEALEKVIQSAEELIGPGLLTVRTSTGGSALRAEEVSESLGTSKENIVQGLRDTAGPSFTANVAGRDVTVEPLDVAATGVQFLFPETLTDAVLFTLPTGKAAIVGTTRTGQAIIRPVQKFSLSESRNARVLAKAWKDQLRFDPRVQRGFVRTAERGTKRDTGRRARIEAQRAARRKERARSRKERAQKRKQRERTARRQREDGGEKTKRQTKGQERRTKAKERRQERREKVQERARELSGVQIFAGAVPAAREAVPSPKTEKKPEFDVKTGARQIEEAQEETLLGTSLEEATGTQFQRVPKVEIEAGTGAKAQQETRQQQQEAEEPEAGQEPEQETAQQTAADEDEDEGDGKKRKDRRKKTDETRRRTTTRRPKAPKRTPKPKRKKRNLSIDEVEVEGKVIPRKGTVAWRQGAFWIVLHWPYNQNSIIWTDEKPPGIPAVSGPDSAEKSIRKFGGKIPKTTKIKMGAFSATVKRGDTKPRLTFERVRGIR